LTFLGQIFCVFEGLLKGINKYQQDLKANTAFVSNVIIFSNQRYKPFQKIFIILRRLKIYEQSN